MTERESEVRQPVKRGSKSSDTRTLGCSSNIFFLPLEASILVFQSTLASFRWAVGIILIAHKKKDKNGTSRSGVTDFVHGRRALRG